ncbi:cupin domain-containing protein [Deinococcus cavernae]|uniref:cupin domain-containing protein n=1 Tax=Deinococcus cavernae TaxID=2320857 RepID=UPI001313D7EB|nr:cupin domain-containing protein [Deinococcus cavernae]
MTQADWHGTVRRAAGQAYLNEELAQTNNHAVNVSVFQGQYPWHVHPDSDETFAVLEGKLVLDVDGKGEVTLRPGQVYTVPAGVKHRSRGEEDRTVNLSFGVKNRETIFLEELK